jgi:hypothetical protein
MHFQATHRRCVRPLQEDTRNGRTATDVAKLCLVERSSWLLFLFRWLQARVRSSGKLALELLDSTGGVYVLQLASKEWMAIAANIHLEVFFGAARCERVATAAVHNNFAISGMDSVLHDPNLGGKRQPAVLKTFRRTENVIIVLDRQQGPLPRRNNRKVPLTDVEPANEKLDQFPKNQPIRNQRTFAR